MEEAHVLAVPMRFDADNTQEILLTSPLTLTGYSRLRQGTITLSVLKAQELLLDTNNFSTSNWFTSTSPTIVVNNQTDPFGLTTADTITPANINGQLIQFVDVGAAANRTWVFGLWLKAAVAHTARLSLPLFTGSGYVAGSGVDEYFDVTTSWQYFTTEYVVPGSMVATSIGAEFYMDRSTGTNAVYAYQASLRERVSLTFPTTLVAGDLLIAQATGVGSEALLVTLSGTI